MKVFHLYCHASKNKVLYLASTLKPNSFTRGIIMKILINFALVSFLFFSFSAHSRLSIAKAISAQVPTVGDFSKEDRKRPVYLIAHRINDINEINYAIRSGANAIECDLIFGRKSIFSKKSWFVDHDGVFAWSTKFNEFLSEIAKVAMKNEENFALVIFDIKTPNGNLRGLYEKVKSILPPSLNIIFSIANYKDRKYFNKINKNLNVNHGLSIDQSNYPEKTAKYFEDTKINNSWFGNGICAGCIETKKIKRSISKAVQMRDRKQSSIKKVYVWSLAKYSSIEYYLLEKNVDGVMVNLSGNTQTHGDGLSDAIDIVQYSNKIRMAKSSDNPFEVF